MIKKTKRKTKTSREEIKVSGENLLSAVKKLIKEGNVRHIMIKNNKGKILFEFPLTAGVVGTLLLPVFAGVGAIATLVGDCTISVERTEK